MQRGPEESAQYVLNHLDPSRIRLQRERKGITGKKLAAKVDVSPSAISQIERGVTKPDIETLIRLSFALSVPVKFFLERPENTRIQLDQCHFRSNRSVPQYERRRTIGDASLLVQLVDLLEDRGVQFPEEELSSFSDEIPVVDEDTPVERMEELAVQLRKHWGMGLGPIPNLVTLLESKGILVLPVPDAHEDLDAFSVWVEDRPVIVLTQDKAASRDRTDCSHEVTHLGVHSDVNPGLKVIEDQAFRFGGAFLAPRSSFSDECPRRWSYAAFEQLKERWKMSIGLMVRRAYDLGHLSESGYRSANIELNKQLRDAGGETAEWDTEKPVMIQQALELLRDEVSLDGLAHELGTNASDLRRLFSRLVDDELLDELSQEDEEDEGQIVRLSRSESNRASSN
jgi:Zn-dependent peptidase ImmA (M78 family)/DNA-binding XRE family transcriptional regulator